MLLHADNVTSDPEIMREFRIAVEKLESVILPVPGPPHWLSNKPDTPIFPDPWILFEKQLPR